MTGSHESIFAIGRDIRSQIGYWPRTWRLIWEAAPRSTSIWLALLVLQGVLPVALVYLTKHIVDGLVAARDSEARWQDVRPVLILVAVFACVMIFIEVVQSLIEWARLAQSETLQDHFKGLIHQQAATLDLGFYESPDYHDRLERAMLDAGTRPLALLESSGSLIQNSVSLLAMAAVLLPYGVWLPFALFASTLPALFVILRFDRRYHRWWQERTVDRRLLQYYDGVLTRGVTAAELRLFALHGHFHSLYQMLRKRLRTERLLLVRQQTLAKLGAAALSLSITGLTLGGMVWRTLQGALTLGDLALFYQAFTKGQGVTRSLLGSVGQLYSNTLFLGNLYEFLDLQPEIAGPSKPLTAPRRLKAGVCFERVNFSYPASDQLALKDFSLTVPAGKVVAIVGENGAGKTTLLKLLCRFYDPQGGRILLDGVDIRAIAPEDLRRQVTMLFQFPVRYVASIKENIATGDIHRQVDRDAIVAAAKSAGAHERIMQSPQGYDSLLGKEVAGGIELSGGEWQRVAMARAYFRQAPIILLDEPTSFMDSWSEGDWFQRFRDLATGRTAIIITHRFTIAMRADVVHVMDHGRIVESGSHRELLAQGGRYAQSWREQMRTGDVTSLRAAD